MYGQTDTIYSDKTNRSALEMVQLKLIYRLGPVNSNAVNSKFHLMQTFFQNLCNFPII